MSKIRRNVNRQELYDEVWREQVRTVAHRFGISDAALCQDMQEIANPHSRRVTDWRLTLSDMWDKRRQHQSIYQLLLTMKWATIASQLSLEPGPNGDCGFV